MEFEGQFRTLTLSGNGHERYINIHNLDAFSGVCKCKTVCPYGRAPWVTCNS